MVDQLSVGGNSCFTFEEAETRNCCPPTAEGIYFRVRRAGRSVRGVISTEGMHGVKGAGSTGNGEQVVLIL